MLDGITNSMNINLGKLQETVKDKGGLACCSLWVLQMTSSFYKCNRKWFKGIKLLPFFCSPLLTCAGGFYLLPCSLGHGENMK